MTQTTASHAPRRSCTPAASGGRGVLPDAAAIAVGAHAHHRAGRTGRGVRIGLSDSGVGALRYFRDRAYRVEGLRSAHDGHGTGMAAMLLAVAPDTTVVSRAAGPEGLAALLAAGDVDLVLCAWGVLGPRPDPGFATGPPVVAADDGLPGTWPAGAHGVTAVRGLMLPCGAFALPGGRHRWSGPSVAAAACCGLAALAIGAGRDPRDAVTDAATSALAVDAAS